MIFLFVPILIIIIVFIITTALVVLYYRVFKRTTHNTKRFEIVIARYNEDLSWMTHPLVMFLLKENEHRTVITIYNKGPNSNHLKHLKAFTNIREYKLNNVGREMHTYTHHMSKQYNDLRDVTIFLPGSCDMLHKFVLMLNILYKAYGEEDSVFYCGDVRDSHQLIRDFKMVSYSSTSKHNYQLNPNRKLTPANLRPFGNWYDKVIGKDVPLDYTTQFGLMAVSRTHIHNRTQSFYDDLLKELSVPDPELGFFIEISWVSIFSPVPTKCINTVLLLSLINKVVNTFKIHSGII